MAQRDGYCYEKQTARLVRVMIDGTFAGWIEQHARRSSGLSAARYTYWTGRVRGQEVTSATLRGVKARIAALPL